MLSSFGSLAEIKTQRKKQEEETRKKEKKKERNRRTWHVIIKFFLVFDTFAQWEDECLCRFK